MLKAFLLAAMLLASALEGRDSAKLKVDVTGLKWDRGSVHIALYNSESKFLKEPLKTAVLPVQGKKAQWVLEALPPGDYALAVIHDENGNGKTDRGAFGIPSEPYAFSNGAKIRLGPPKWKEARFPVRAPATAVEVRLR